MARAREEKYKNVVSSEPRRKGNSVKSSLDTKKGKE